MNEDTTIVNSGRINFTLSQKAISYLNTHRKGERSSFIDTLIIQFHESSQIFDPAAEEQEIIRLRAEISTREHKLRTFREELKQKLNSQALKEKLLDLVRQYPDILIAYKKRVISNPGKAWILKQLGIASWKWVEEQLDELIKSSDSENVGTHPSFQTNNFSSSVKSPSIDIEKSQTLTTKERMEIPK